MAFIVKWVGGDCGDGKIWFVSQQRTTLPKFFCATWSEQQAEAKRFNAREDARKATAHWGKNREIVRVPS